MPLALASLRDLCGLLRLELGVDGFELHVNHFYLGGLQVEIRAIRFECAPRCLHFQK
jgi:hypothetical protein